MQDESKSASSVSIRDFLTVKLAEGAILTIETPNGTKATIRQGSPPAGRVVRESWDSEESKGLGSSLVISSEDESNAPKKLGGRLRQTL